MWLILKGPVGEKGFFVAFKGRNCSPLRVKRPFCLFKVSKWLRIVLKCRSSSSASSLWRPNQSNVLPSGTPNPIQSNGRYSTNSLGFLLLLLLWALLLLRLSQHGLAESLTHKSARIKIMDKLPRSFCTHPARQENQQRWQRRPAQTDTLSKKIWHLSYFT